MSCGSYLQKGNTNSQRIPKDIRNLITTIAETNCIALDIFIDIQANFLIPMMTEFGNFAELGRLYENTLRSVMSGSFNALVSPILTLNEKFASVCKKQDALYERLTSFHKVMDETDAKWEAKKWPTVSDLEGKSANEMKIFLNDVLKFWKDQERFAAHGRSDFEELKAEWDAVELEKAFMECIQEVTNLKESMSPCVI